MERNVILSASDMRNLAEISVLLDTTISLQVYLPGIYQVNWKKGNTSYMWRSNTDLIEIAHNKDYDNMEVLTPKELIDSLK